MAPFGVHFEHFSPFLALLGSFGAGFEGAGASFWADPENFGADPENFGPGLEKRSQPGPIPSPLLDHFLKLYVDFCGAFLQIHFQSLF